MKYFISLSSNGFAINRNNEKFYITTCFRQKAKDISTLIRRKNNKYNTLS